MRHRFGSALVAICGVYGLRVSAKTSLLIRRLAPRAAAGDAEAAASETQTPYARAILGIPNSDLATAYYAAILILHTSGALYRRPVLRVTRAAAWGTVGFSAYLIHALFFRLHRRCPVCMRAHAANLVLTLALQFLVRARD
ncbi:MAG: Vitamin epoxide reductase family [Chloroflexi bacterium]|jgi:uncharacterized membrane protein|nr:Vitamin epoxide reductase family [Chloroflexota bacterium]